MPKFSKIFIVLTLVLSPLFAIRYSLFANIARAAISACTVVVAPQSYSTGVPGVLTFGITNNDSSNAIRWLKITAPSSDFVITNGTGQYLTSTTINTAGSEIVIKLSGLPSGEYDEYYISVTTGDSVISAIPFGVSVSDSDSGDNPVGCSGDTKVAITSPGQEVVNIANTTVSVNDTTATISWNTGTNTTGEVTYGTTSQYGNSTTDSNSSVNHSVSLSGLSANTLYHFRVYSTDTNNNVAQLTDNTFTTASSGTTTTTVTTTTNIVTVTPKADTSPPSITVATNFEKPFEVAPEITGHATDSSRIVKVEYSIDSGVNWIFVENSNLGEKAVNFNFTPDISDDGDYKIIIRAMDGVGNIGKSKIYNLVIDRLPPLVGANIWSVGPIPILPDTDGVITLLSGVDNKIIMSAVGGPISIDLIIGGQTYSMIKSVDSGLWSGIVNFSAIGNYVVKVKSIDGAGNTTVRNLNSILVISSGQVTEKGTDNVVVGANLSVYQQDDVSKIWSLWDAPSFGQKNPQTISGTGSYSYFLPAGTYYLIAQATGFVKVTSRIFTISSPTILNTDIGLAKGWWINPFDSINMAVNRDINIQNEQNINSLVGKEAPSFSLRSIGEKEINLLSFRGKPRVLVFLNTWLPGANEQISQIKSLPKNYKDKITVVMVEENISRVSVFAKKGGYDDLSIVADSDGTLMDSYQLNSLPTSYFIDRKGLVQKVISGVLSGDEIKNILDLL